MKTFNTTLLTLSIGLGLAFTSQSFGQKMYWLDAPGDLVKRADSDGTNIENISSSTSNPFAVDVDKNNSKVYWSNGGGSNKIQRADLDGSNVEDLVTTGLASPRGLSLDVDNGKMYWTDVGFQKIKRANLDGSTVEELITSGLSAPIGIEVDAVNSKMYWVDEGSNKVQRANLDGTTVEDLVTGLTTPFDITLDVANSKMYWVDGGTKKIQRANLDGTSVEDLVTGLEIVRGIVIDLTNSKIYWTNDADSGTDKIQRSNLDGTGVEDLIVGGISNPYGIALDFGDTPLSVELDSFQARQIANSIQLTWSTASETENEGFNLYRKTGNSFYTQIASYKGNSELLGALNSTVSNKYTFVDNSELRNGETYTYYISDVETNGLETKHEEQAQTVKFTLDEEIAQTKLHYVLAQNFPNPFNPSTQINFQIAKTQDVRLQVYNLKGELVKEIVNEKMNKGSHSANWNGTDNFGNQVSSGTYFYKISAGTFTQTNKMILLK
ncbi:MAG: T9SS C-terminal target domain-containing protein [Calditrichaeota bacterium]|nr:MAG: T9SS C-terminal target domain-containing protein [Calditrichota bacterium]